MAGSSYEQKMKGLYKITDDAWNLYHVIEQDADVTSSDWENLGRMRKL